MTAPSFVFFNWADSHAGLNDPARMLWMANRYGERSLAIAARYHLDGSDMTMPGVSVHGNPIGKSGCSYLCRCCWCWCCCW